VLPSFLYSRMVGQLSCLVPYGPNSRRRMLGLWTILMLYVWARKRWMPMTSLAVNVA